MYIINNIYFAIFVNNVIVLLLNVWFEPRGVAVNHAGLWILRRRFESARGHLLIPFPRLIKQCVEVVVDVVLWRPYRYF